MEVVDTLVENLYTVAIRRLARSQLPRLWTKYHSTRKEHKMASPTGSLKGGEPKKKAAKKKAAKKKAAKKKAGKKK